MEISKPVLFSFDYPPLDGGISRLCSEIVEQATTFESAQFRVITGILPRPKRELQAFGRLLSLPSESFCICGLWYPEGLLATLAGVKRIVILAHGAELLPTRQPWRRGIWKILQNWVLSRSDLVVANSHFTAQLVQRVAPKAKVIAIPLAVDPVRFSPGNKSQSRQKFNLPDGKFIISSVSRIHIFKGFETVFRAIASLPSKERENILYTIAGTGPDREKLKITAEQLGISDQVHWLGFVSNDDLPDVYRASDVFVLCTQENLNNREVEGFGLVFLEAQSCGTPVIGTRTGGIPDAISDTHGGWLLPPNDADGLASRLSHLMNNRQVLKAQGAAARQRVLDSCTWKKYVSRLFKELRSHGVINE